MEANTSDDSHAHGAGRSHVEGEVPIDGDPLDHLWNAAHEMLRALRGLLEAADEFVETQRARPAHVAHEPRAGRVHNIDIDVPPDDPAHPDTHTDAHTDS
ncbi:MAG: hypothetical protein QOE62_866 [Actinomycetota bacterium]|jgi:hypothetical protein|nr:hypothetical protein [Actinomycetota bacterium]